MIEPAQFYATPAVVLNDGIFLARTNEARNGLVQISLRKIAQRVSYIGWSYEALKWGGIHKLSRFFSWSGCR